ncbi:MAG TPA: polysaccharide biosynthesis tyrosine autokinase, partial [Ruminococcus flavefaciens]|nr:polysaccharide biosynthesis tyrosine autokinase [Ruminococcus flavefaciens]
PNPVGPNIKKNTALGAIAGAMLMALIILVIDFFDNTFKDPEALKEKYKKAVVGEIQDFTTGRKKKGEDDHFKLTDGNIPFYITESYKSLRTNITFALATSDKKIFAISSANPSEGKSTVSANTAIALAQGGNKVLLVDADMRKSVQHKIFDLKNKKGLSTAVSKMNSVEECIIRNVEDNLDVMCAGPIPPNPSELLASENMSQMLEKLSAEYSAIVIDTPPINVVTDAMELARNISGIILVTSYGKTTVDDMDSAMKKIEFANMNLLGFILNGIKIKKNGKYYSNYKYKSVYGYGNDPEQDDDNSSDSDKNNKSDSKENDKKDSKNNKKGKKGGK